jgi:hypothetical protein
VRFVSFGIIAGTTSWVRVTEGATYGIEWAPVDVGIGSVVVCYNLKCSTWFKYNLNRVYISSWVLSSCKPVFKDEFYLNFVLVDYANFVT